MELVVDTNIVFSALIGTKTKDTLSIALITVELHTVTELFKELEEHWVKITKHTYLPAHLLDQFYKTIRDTTTMHSTDIIPDDIIEMARRLVAGVDPDDWPFVALAMYMDAPLWTGDKGLLALSAETGFKWFTAVDTEGVEMLLRGKSLDSVLERMREKYVK